MNRLDMAQWIVNAEARRDGSGRIQVYKLPSNDGGGSFEVAGINERYHPAKARQLRSLIEAGKHSEAEAAAVDYLADYTDAVMGWVSVDAVEFFLRDAAFNRGPAGAAKIAQMAVGVTEDGKVGPQTKRALAAVANKPFALLARLRAARERYENRVAPGRANLRTGLVNRWDNITEAACRAV